MAGTAWAAGVDGNWNTAARWTNGVPDSSLDVHVDAPGHYTVTVSHADTAGSFVLDAAHATLSETAGASLNVGFFTSFISGTAILNGSNEFAIAFIQGATVELGSASAMGSSSVFIESGQLLTLANMTLNNSLTLAGSAPIAAAHGTTLKLTDPSFDIDAGLNAVTLGEGGHDGTIVWNAKLGTDNSAHDYTVDIRAGTVKAGVTNNGFAQLIPADGHLVVEAGATLDLGHYLIVAPHLAGDGTITDAQPFGLLIAEKGKFGGTIAGTVRLEVQHGIVTLTGNNTYAGGTQIDASGHLVLSGDGSIAGDIQADGSVAFFRDDSVKIKNTISGAGVVAFDRGDFTVAHANNFTGESEIGLGARLTIDRPAAIGTGLLIDNGTFVASRSFTINESYDFVGDSAIEVTYTHTLKLDGSSGLELDGALSLGGPGNDGTILWNVAGNGVLDADADRLEVRAGTVRIGPDGGISLNDITQFIDHTVIDAGATLDIAGTPLSILSLEGAGTVTSAKTGFSLLAAGGNFAGAITNKIELVVFDTLVLTGASNYHLGTEIESGVTLRLGHGGTSGSITGDVFNDGGTLLFDRSNSMSFDGEISGGGGVRQFGSGTTKLTAANSYTGGTQVSGGVLQANHIGAFGSGAISLDGGTLASGITQTLTNAVFFHGDGAIAAVHGRTLTIDSAGGWSVQTGAAHVNFGIGGDDGTVIWNTPGGSAAHGAYDVGIDAGTLKAGTGDFTLLFDNATATTIAHGATLDVNGTPLLELVDLEGAGAIRNSGAFATISLTDSNFAGTIGANIAIIAEGTVRLSGGGAFNVAGIDTGAKLHLANAAHEDVTFDGTHAFLILDDPNQFTGTVSGFARTDKIDLTGIKFAGAHFTFNAGTDVMTVANGGHSAQVQFADGYHSGDFDLANDGHGHVDIVTHLLNAPHAIGGDPPVADGFVEFI